MVGSRLVLAVTLLAPLAAAGCFGGGPANVGEGTCEELAYGWLRWLQPANLTQVEQILSSLGYETRWYDDPQGNSWLLFRHDRQAGDQQNETARRFASVLRVFSLVDANATGNATTGENITQLSTHFVRRADDSPLPFPEEVQRAQLTEYMSSMEDLFNGSLGQPDSRFADMRTACIDEDEEEWGLDLTAESSPYSAEGPGERVREEEQ